MADISKCANKNCKIKDMCYRHTAPEGYWQSYMMFGENKKIKDKNECEYFWQDRRKGDSYGKHNS